MQQYYPILQPNKDFRFTETLTITKGRRVKRSAEVFPSSTQQEQTQAFFKYRAEGYQTSELCSEKIASELAHLLGYRCARIEFAVDEDDMPGILSFLFTNSSIQHIDAVAFLKDAVDEKPKDFYRYSHVRAKLDAMNETFFPEFVSILFFDALVGEGDRHEENWGICEIKSPGTNDNVTETRYRISPLYDTGDCLLRDFAEPSFAQKYYDGPCSFASYITRAKAMLRDDNGKKFNHFKLMEFLNDEFHDIIKTNIEKLKQELKDEVINKIIESIPEEMLTTQHRDFIKDYIKERRDILIGMEK
ncbi:MAG: hypothetical protein Q4B34_03140 [Candidatus Saccharibacteria bacterium]|nr:hypothetical protein [Candidatus Saccharibacteria bacterium]